MLVFAASSLTEVMTELAEDFNRTNPGIQIQLNFAGSATLREQILGGASADVAIVANDQIMGDLLSAGAVSAPAVAARNQMVLVVPKDNPANVNSLSDLSEESLLVGLCSEGVPCGSSARQILIKAGVSVSIDTNEPNVRSLLAKVTQGELDAGIVYVTDLARAGLGVSSIAIEPRFNVTNNYLIATVIDGDNPAGAKEFTQFVLSPHGQQIFADFGFLRPEAAAS